MNDDMVPDEDLKATDSTSQILTNSGTIGISYTYSAIMTPASYVGKLGNAATPVS